jgi:hypothetical protein
MRFVVFVERASGRREPSIYRYRLDFPVAANQSKQIAESVARELHLSQCQVSCVAASETNAVAETTATATATTMATKEVKAAVKPTVKQPAARKKSPSTQTISARKSRGTRAVGEVSRSKEPYEPGTRTCEGSDREVLDTSVLHRSETFNSENTS